MIKNVYIHVCTMFNFPTNDNTPLCLSHPVACWCDVCPSLYTRPATSLQTTCHPLCQLVVGRSLAVPSPPTCFSPPAGVSLFEARSTENMRVAATSATKPPRTARLATHGWGLAATRSNKPRSPRLNRWPKRRRRTSIRSCCLARRGPRRARETSIPAALVRTGRGFSCGQSTPSNCWAGSRRASILQTATCPIRSWTTGSICTIATILWWWWVPGKTETRTAAAGTH